jgi:hypothetical protein
VHLVGVLVVVAAVMGYLTGAWPWTGQGVGAATSQSSGTTPFAAT